MSLPEYGSRPECGSLSDFSPVPGSPRPGVLSERLIGAAIGVTMIRYDLSYEDAVDFLVALSLDQRCALTELADRVLRINDESRGLRAGKPVLG